MVEFDSGSTGIHDTEGQWRILVSLVQVAWRTSQSQARACTITSQLTIHKSDHIMHPLPHD